MYLWNQYANDKNSETLSLTMQNDTLDNITLMQESKESNLYFIQNVCFVMWRHIRCHDITSVIQLH